MKKISILILLTVFGSVGIAQEKSVYFSECKKTEDHRRAEYPDDRAYEESKRVKIEIKDKDIMLTETKFNDLICHNATFKRVTIGQIRDGSSLNQKVALFSRSFDISGGLRFTGAVFKMTGHLILSAAQVNQLPEVVRNEAAGITTEGGVNYYERTRFEAKAQGQDIAENTNGLTRIQFDETSQSIMYRNQALVLQKNE